MRRALQKSNAKRAPSWETQLEEVPFVPAFDLLEAQERLITPQKIAAIGAALFSLTSDPEEERHNSLWENVARLEAVSRRLA